MRTSKTSYLSNLGGLETEIFNYFSQTLRTFVICVMDVRDIRCLQNPKCELSKSQETLKFQVKSTTTLVILVMNIRNSRTSKVKLEKKLMLPQTFERKTKDFNFH